MFCPKTCTKTHFIAYNHWLAFKIHNFHHTTIAWSFFFLQNVVKICLTLFNPLSQFYVHLMLRYKILNLVTSLFPSNFSCYIFDIWSSVISICGGERNKRPHLVMRPGLTSGVYIVQKTVCTVYSVMCTLYSVLCTVYRGQFAVYSWSLQFTV